MFSLRETVELNKSLGDLIKLLAEDKGLSSIEIAETLWLALQMQPAVEIIPDEQLIEPTRISLPPLDIDAVSESLPATRELEPKADLISPSPKSGLLPSEVLPVWVAEPAMLTDPLSIIQSLKPLTRQLAESTDRKLDEVATVEYIARTGLWLPILAPVSEPWFDIILVIDRSSSMHIWQKLLNDLVQTLRRYGVFRDLRVFDLEVNTKAQVPEDLILLKSQSDHPGHRPNELIEQGGRRIAIVLSDCAGKYWWDGTLLPMLQTWASVMPTVVWQMLPAWMWERTALGRGTPVALSNNMPGAANQQLMIQIMGQQLPTDADYRISIPVITSQSYSLYNWSLMLAGDDREVTPGFLLPLRGGMVPKTKTIEDIARERVEIDDSIRDIEEAILVIAHRRVERFQQLSSPSACRLLMLLAAAPVITIPVMRLIRDSMMDGESSPLPVAEVFLSGLLERLPGQESLEPDNVQYDFFPKSRAVLLEVLPKEDTIKVINIVSAAVEKQWNMYSQLSFRAFLLSPDDYAASFRFTGLSFARIIAEILEPLGSEYTELIRHLRQ